MPTSDPSELVRAFLKARLTYDAEKIAALLDDDIEWSMSGPIDVLRYAGQKRGRDAVLEALVIQGPTSFKLDDLTIEEIIVDGDTAVTRSRVIGVQLSTNRKITYQCAQLFRFRNGKLTVFRCINDSFDAAEQVLGRAIGDAGLFASTNARPALSRSAV